MRAGTETGVGAGIRGAADAAVGAEAVGAEVAGAAGAEGAAVRAQGDAVAGSAAGAGAGARGMLGAFVRFVVCGGGVSVLSSAVLMATAGWVPFAASNAVVTVASTLLTTELHHRFTFGEPGAGPRTGARHLAGGFAGWRIHAKSALTLAVAYAFTTAAVMALDVLHPHTGQMLTQAVYLGASGVAGLGRFLVLRLVVFAHRPARPAAPRLHRDRVTVAA